MTQITSPVPEVGFGNAAEQVKATNLLQEIKNLLNNGIGTDNLSAALQAAVQPPRVTALPSDPTDGQTVDFVADADGGVVWRLRYRASSSSPYKWEFVGGSALRRQSTGDNTFNVSTGWTSGPEIVGVTVPLGGDYDVAFGATRFSSNAAGKHVKLGVVSAGAALLSRDLFVANYQSTPPVLISAPVGGEDRLLARPSNSLMQVAAAAEEVVSVACVGRWIAARPVRVG